MAFDGIVISALAEELREKLVGGRIVKISQPEKEELILTIKNYDQYRLFLSVGAGLPLVYLTKENKPAPLTAPNFCMLLRKYLNSARILEIEQPEFERTLRIRIEHLNELGDLCVKYLIVEIMGKHSNIIFCDEEMKVVDSIRHVSGMVSSVREVLPGRPYFIPNTGDKKDPFTVDASAFVSEVLHKPLPAAKAIYQSLNGISPQAANELCFRAGVDADRPANVLSYTEKEALAEHFERLKRMVSDKLFMPVLYCREDEPVEYAVMELRCYDDMKAVPYDTVSKLLQDFYSARNRSANIRQHSAELRKLVATFYERAIRKLDLQNQQLRDTEKREKYKVYGELLTTYGYTATPGAKALTVVNYYDGQELTIPLDETLTAIENAKHYFERYSKQKRTAENLEKLIPETEGEVWYLDSVRTALDLAATERDLEQIREELAVGGYVKKLHKYSKDANKKGKNSGKGKQAVSKAAADILHYVSSDGYDIYVGKNNVQNEELTFKLGEGKDWWFHAKGIPGSHVLVKANGEEMPDRVYEEAGALAAYYSSARGTEKVEVDYTLKKNIRKPSGGRPGFVVYYTNYSLIADGREPKLKMQ